MVCAGPKPSAPTKKLNFPAALHLLRCFAVIEITEYRRIIICASSSTPCSCGASVKLRRRVFLPFELKQPVGIHWLFCVVMVLEIKQPAGAAGCFGWVCCLCGLVFEFEVELAGHGFLAADDLLEELLVALG